MRKRAESTREYGRKIREYMQRRMKEYKVKEKGKYWGKAARL